MPTEILNIVSTGTSKRSLTLIPTLSPAWPDNMSSLLTASGWAQSLILRPYWSVNYVFFFATVDGLLVFPLVSVDATQRLPFLTVGTIEFRFYDPGRELPIAATGNVWVAMKTSVTAGVNEIATKVTGNTEWDCSIFGGSTTYTSDDGQILGNPRGVGDMLVGVLKSGSLPTAFNNVPIINGAGFAVGGGHSRGGGYEFISGTANSGTALTLRVFWDDLVGPNPIHLNFYSQGYAANAEAAVSLPPGMYVAMANQLGCCMFPDDPTSVTNGYDSSFLAAAVTMEDETPPITGTFAFCATPGSVEHLYWTSHRAFNGAFVPGPNAQYDSLAPRLLAPHDAGTPIQFSSGEPIVTTALVMFGLTGQGLVVGLLADCMVQSDYYAPGSQISFQGVNYTAVASESPYQPGAGRAIATLFWAES